MQISENSRIWIYQANRELNPEEIYAIQEQLNHFTQSWEAHGKALAAKGEIRYNRFIILAIDEAQAGATGCSIDKSVALLKQIENEFGIQLFDRMQIAYRDAESVKTCSKEQFEELIQAGLINEDSLVFNNLIETYRDLNEHWEVPLKNSWHSRVFTV